MRYVVPIPATPSFNDKGMQGYVFGPLQNQELEMYFVDVKRGHDTFIISKRITRIYYVLEGKGYFTIENQRYPVEAGMLIEVPPKLEYSYTGMMKLIVVSIPRWIRGNEKITKKNPDVFSDLNAEPDGICPGTENTPARHNVFAYTIHRILGKVWPGHNDSVVMRFLQKAFRRITNGAPPIA